MSTQTSRLLVTEPPVWFITGCSSGFGRELAKQAIEHGYRTVVTARDVTTLESYAAAENAMVLQLDVTQPDQVAAAIAATEERFGWIDVLVNNAGIAGANKPTHEITEAEWDFVQGINVKGVFFCTKHAIAHLKRAGGGSIINLSSIYGLVGAADLPPYHASKGAVRLMSKTDALLYAPDKIRVNSIHPGFIWTPMVEHHLSAQGDLAEGRRATDGLHPLGHMGEPDDVAWGVVYLASDEAKFITGAELVIDGGYTAR